jgi:acetylornithine deacetylase/succinyl-diaminopimelate desuccinylase-like protein
MGQRRDALTAASDMVLAIEAHCQRNPGLVGTVGQLSVLPGAVNVIAQEVRFSLDVRSGIDATRYEAVEAIRAQCEAIAAKRSVRLEFEPYFELKAAPCDERLQAQLADAITAQGLPVMHLPSGAGHDAMAFPAVCPMAMLFVRCGNGGISHHPDEILSAQDAEQATCVLLGMLERFGLAD